MRKKKFKTNVKKADKIIEKYSHFGYVVASKEEKSHGKVILRLEQRVDNRKNLKKVKKLEKYYKKIHRKFPIGAVIWTIIATVLFLGYLGYEKPEVLPFDLSLLPTLPEIISPYLFVLLFFACIFYALALYYLIVFIVELFAFPSLKEGILHDCDIVSGNKNDIPFKKNIAKEDKYSNVLKSKKPQIIKVK